MDKISIRNATKADAKAIQAIYAPYVERTAISFEYEVPTVEEMAQRMEVVQKEFPWLVAEENERVVGYIYAHAFHERAAFQWAVETSIYVKWDEKRKGIGRKLHDALETALKQQGILNLNACIAFVPDNNKGQGATDPYLNLDSVRFHEQMGYIRAAHFHQCGKKFGHWYDMIWMEKIIGEHL